MLHIRTGRHTILTLKNERGEVENGTIIILGSSGTGKGILGEALTEEFHKQGYVVLIIADPKNEMEYGYAMFEPISQFHLNYLKSTGKRPERKNVKLYHPFTFRLPRHALPEINFYTFSLKDLGRQEWSLIAETGWDTDNMKLLLNASETISSSDGLYGFVHYLFESVKGRQEGKGVKSDPNRFHLPVTGGTGKSLQDVVNYLKPFEKDYFLAPDNCKLNLDWKEILSDQEHYHFFSSKWLGDDKQREFCVMALFNQVIKHKDACKHPVLFVIPEIRALTPVKAEGYKKFLAQGITRNLSMFRSQGRGMSAILDTQVYTGVEEEVIKSATDVLLGRIMNIRDIDALVKARGYRHDMRDRLAKLGKGLFYLMGKEDIDELGVLMPSHRHCEESYNFFEHYKAEYGDKMKDYSQLIAEMRSMLDSEEEKFKERMKKREKDERERIEAIKKAREEKSAKAKKLDEKIEKATQIKEKVATDLMKLVYETKQANPDMSWRELAAKFNLDHKTAKRYCEKYEKSFSAGQSGTQDFEEQTIQELESGDSPEPNDS